MTSAEDRAAADTVEQVVREQLTTALGGLRGTIESAVPTVAFTVCYVITHQTRASIIVGVAAAAVLVLIRLAQRSTVKFVLNSLFGILIAAFFAARSGKAQDAFLPGILTNAGYAVAMIISVVTRWPLLGFVVGAATGDPTGWRSNAAMVKLCSRLTLLQAVPCVLRVLVETPLYKAGEVGALGTAKVVLGWPLQVAALLAAGALLARGRTPLEGAAPPD